MTSKTLCALAAFATLGNAQFASYTTKNHAISVNVPSDTASSGNGPIYMQISAPSGTAWTAFGQGNQMRGANMFIIYAGDNGNVTLSPRLGQGHFEPQYNSNAQVTLLEGSAVNSDGSLVANIRCDGCLSWSGGSMSPTNSESNWIWAYKNGDALQSADTSESLREHDDYSRFSLDLTAGTGGNSANPFVSAATDSSGSASPSSSATVSGSSGGSTPVASTSPNTASSDSSSSSSSSSSDDSKSSDSFRQAHGIVMSLAFLIFFPLGALTMYLPFSKRVRFIHAPLQFLSLIMLIVGLALGVVLGQKADDLDGYHQIIGYVIVGLLVLFQPALGIYQHMYYHKTGGRSPLGIVHKWLGLSVIILGIINGGLGFMISGSVGSDDVPSWAVIAYSVVAGVVVIVYASVALASGFAKRRTDRPSRSAGKHGHKAFDMRDASDSPQIHGGNQNSFTHNRV